MKVHFTSFQMTSISSRLASYFPKKSSGKILLFDKQERAVMMRAQTSRAMYICYWSARVLGWGLLLYFSYLGEDIVSILVSRRIYSVTIILYEISMIFGIRVTINTRYEKIVSLRKSYVLHENIKENYESRYYKMKILLDTRKNHWLFHTCSGPCMEKSSELFMQIGHF